MYVWIDENMTKELRWLFNELFIPFTTYRNVSSVYQVSHFLIQYTRTLSNHSISSSVFFGLVKQMAV